MQVRKYLFLALAVTALIVGILTTVLMLSSNRDTRNIGGADGVLGGEFTLNSIDGPVSLSDFSGKAVIMYFGFTECPEVCPNSMNIIARSIDMLAPVQKEKVQALMVSIDPKRDNLEKLDAYTQYFHPQILGITGSDAELETVTQEYGVFFEVDDVESSDNYAFTHTSRYFVIDPQGQLVTALRHSTTANELAAQIRQIL